MPTHTHRTSPPLPEPTTSTAGRRGAALCLGIAAVSFAAYPALRPWSTEAGLAGAHTFSTSRWIVSHSIGILAFVTLAAAFRQLGRVDTPAWWNGGTLRSLESRGLLAAALVLPYYGAEAFALPAIGRWAGEHQSADAHAIAESFRLSPIPATVFVAGLIVLAAVGVRLARSSWQSGSMVRNGGILAGLGLLTYLPQFFAPPIVRVIHGIVLGLGLAMLAAAVAHNTGVASRNGAAAAGQRAD
jgi:hypothetical protein